MHLNVLQCRDEEVTVTEPYLTRIRLIDCHNRKSEQAALNSISDSSRHSTEHTKEISIQKLGNKSTCPHTSKQHSESLWLVLRITVAEKVFRTLSEIFIF